MTQPDFKQPQLWLILPMLLVLAPHALELPLWISLSWLLFALVSMQFVGWKNTTLFRHTRWPQLLKMFLTLAGVAGVLLQYGTVIGPQGGVALLIFLSGAKLLETQTPRDRLGLLFVGCFLLVAYFLNSQSLAMAAYMIVVAIALVAAMIANTQPKPDLRATFGLAFRLLLQALPLTLLLFLLFPRLQGPLWGLPQQTTAQTGLSDHMSPGDFSQLSQSDEIAFRVEFTTASATRLATESPDPSALYWRGPVLWDFDGRTWQTRLALPHNPLRAEGRGQPVSYSITLEPHRQRWLFLLGLPRKWPPNLAQVESSLGPDLQWIAKAPVTQRLRYQIDADLDYRLDPDGLSAATRARTLALPEGNPETRAMAQRWSAGLKTDRGIVEKALSHFRSEPFFYTLNPPRLGDDSIDDFLLRSRRGFCEHYASAFVFLMRASGIPARVVTGYQGGELNPLGNYWIVRQRDAHAWAEVWLTGQGWMRIDPTAAVAPNRVERGLNAALPAGERRTGLMTLNANWLLPMQLTWDLLNNQWNQWVLGYNQDRQRQFLARLNPFLATLQGMAWGLAAAGGGLLLLMAALVLPRLGHRRTDPACLLYAHFCQRLQRCGIVRGRSEGPADFAARATALRPDLAIPIGHITRLYLTLRYGGSGVSKLPEFKHAVSAFRPRLDKARGTGNKNIKRLSHIDT